MPTLNDRMNDIEASILTALKELDIAVKAMPTASPKPNLLPLFARIDELAQQLPRGPIRNYSIFSSARVTRRRGRDWKAWAWLVVRVDVSGLAAILTLIHFL